LHADPVIFRSLLAWWPGTQNFIGLFKATRYVSVKNSHLSLSKCSYMLQSVDRVAQSVWRLTMGWTVGGSNPGGGEIFRTRPDPLWGPTQPPVRVQGVLSLFRG
jgi:hypothetical protein